MRAFSQRSPRGVTLIELMVAVVIMMMVAGAVSRLLVRSWQSEEVTNDQNLAQKTAQQAADIIVDRLRGGAKVTSGDEDEITVAYRNSDLVTFDTVTFSLEGRALHRTRHSAATGETVTETPVPDFLSGLTFAYRQRNSTGWEPADTAAAADLVVVSVTAASGGCHATETSVVKLRNKT